MNCRIVLLSVLIGLAGKPSMAVDTTFASSGPSEGVFVGRNGDNFSYCPQFSCLTFPTPDHQRANVLIAATTRDDGHSEEQTIGVETYVRTGFNSQWIPIHSYIKGQNVSNKGQIYRALSSGKSGNGSGPDGNAYSIDDGSVKWRWINAASIDGKVGIYNELGTYEGGGASWGQANNVQLQAGAKPTFNINTELDFSNNAANCEIGVASCHDLYISANGPFQSTSAVSILTGVADSAAHTATIWGLRLSGSKLASDDDIEDDSSAAIGLGFGTTSIVPTHHQTATIADKSISNVGMLLKGKYSVAQIDGNGWSIDPRGVVLAHGFIMDLKTPTSSREVCIKGQFVNDSSYYYVCTAKDHWKRTALVDF